MENDEPSISKTRWPNQSPATSVAGTRILTTARRTVWKTANGSRARAWQKALAVKARPASKETWVKAVLPWRTWMRNQWIMAAGVKRQRSHHEWPAWRQAWWMKSQPSLAARSCLRVLRVVEIRRCIAGPPVPWWVRKILLCTGVPLFSRDEAAWGYRCLNAIRHRPLSQGSLPLRAIWHNESHVPSVEMTASGRVQLGPRRGRCGLWPSARQAWSHWR